jgi:hypothetical protein
MGAAKTMTDVQRPAIEPTVSCKRITASGQVRAIRDRSRGLWAYDEELACGTVDPSNPQAAICTFI